MLLRDAHAEEALAITALVESAYRGEASRAGWTTEADLLDGQRTDLTAITAALADDQSVLVVAVDGELVVGCCQVQRRPDRGYFGTFAVQPTSQARGIGSALLVEAERRTTAWGLGVLEMTVLAHRPDLIAWYRRRGYAPTGEVRPFPYGDERFGRPRREDLSFAVLTKELGDYAQGTSSGQSAGTGDPGRAPLP